MESITLGSAIDVIVMAVLAVGASWRGYWRRKEHWTRGSWIGLGLVVLVGIAFLMLTFRIAIAVDNHEAWVGAPQSGTRNYYALLGLGALVGGVALAGGSLGWFATGDPSRPFPFLGSTRRGPADPNHEPHPNTRVEEALPSA